MILYHYQLFIDDYPYQLCIEKEGNYIVTEILAFLIQDEDITNAVEDAGFEAEVIPEPSTNGVKQHGTLSGQFSIGGMTCAACVNSVEGILKGLPGVKRAVVALATSLGEVEYDPTVISKDDIVNAIEDAGFEASLVQSSEQDKIILGVAGIFSEIDAQLLEAIISNLKGVRHFRLDRISRELEILFDTEVVTSRSLVDGIEGASNGKFKLQVANPYTRMTCKDVDEASNMFRLFISSLVLSVSTYSWYLHGYVMHHFVNLVSSFPSFFSLHSSVPF